MRVAEMTGRDPRSGRSLRVVACDGVVARIEEISTESDLYLSAGFVDLQVNGFSGFDVNAANLCVETIVGLTDMLLRHGVTCFVPTIITAAEAGICNALRVIANSRELFPRVADCVPYVHVEGPHISSLDGYRGAHRAEFVRAPSIAEFERWQAASDGLVGMVTLSPHYPDSAEYIAHLSRRGVHVALGHTHARPEQVKRAVDAGARLSTHLGNGIAAEIPRHGNPLWSQLADDRLTATVIADGDHLPQELLKVILRAKSVEKTVLVSDSVALAGMAPGTYETPVGGRVELRADGRLCLHGTELLAGSTTTLSECVSTVVRTLGASLPDALAMATTNPGRFASGRGKLAVGCAADLVRFRWNERIEIEDVWLRGERVYARAD
jgi:N-acetylglucosamine-6-phosphate deacetylase